MLALLDGGGCRSSTAPWDCWTQPQCLGLSNQTSAQFLLSWGISPSLLGSFSASPFLKSPVGSAIITLSSHSCVILPTAFFWYWSTNSTTGPIYPGQQVQWARPPFSSSLRAPAGKCANSVSAYGILQESCYLVTVLLQIKRTELHPPKETVK